MLVFGYGAEGESCGFPAAPPPFGEDGEEVATAAVSVVAAASAYGTLPTTTGDCGIAAGTPKLSLAHASNG